MLRTSLSPYQLYNLALKIYILRVYKVICRKCICQDIISLDDNGVFGKSSYHAKNVPYLLQATVLARNGIYHTGNDYDVMKWCNNFHADILNLPYLPTKGNNRLS